MLVVVIMFLNSSSSAVRQRVSNDGESSGTKRQRALRRMKASIRFCSAAVVKPHHALDAYRSLAMTTERKTVCSVESHIPRARKTRSAYSDFAQLLIFMNMVGCRQFIGHGDAKDF